MFRVLKVDSRDDASFFFPKEEKKKKKKKKRIRRAFAALVVSRKVNKRRLGRSVGRSTRRLYT